MHFRSLDQFLNILYRELLGYVKYMQDKVQCVTDLYKSVLLDIHDVVQYKTMIPAVQIFVSNL